jgi:hypothetical protein
MEKEGIQAVYGLPAVVKQGLISKYQSVEEYYLTLYRAGAEYYKSFVSKDKIAKKRYEDLRLFFAEELESLGVDDGLDIVDLVWGDFDEDLVRVKYQ